MVGPIQSSGLRRHAQHCGHLFRMSLTWVFIFINKEAALGLSLRNPNRCPGRNCLEYMPAAHAKAMEASPSNQLEDGNLQDAIRHADRSGQIMAERSRRDMDEYWQQPSSMHAPEDRDSWQDLPPMEDIPQLGMLDTELRGAPRTTAAGSAYADFSMRPPLQHWDTQFDYTRPTEQQDGLSAQDFSLQPPFRSEDADFAYAPPAMQQHGLPGQGLLQQEDGLAASASADLVSRQQTHTDPKVGEEQPSFRLGTRRGDDAALLQTASGTVNGDSDPLPSWDLQDAVKDLQAENAVLRNELSRLRNADAVVVDMLKNPRFDVSDAVRHLTTGEPSFAPEVIPANLVGELNHTGTPWTNNTAQVDQEDETHEYQLAMLFIVAILIATGFLVAFANSHSFTRKLSSAPTLEGAVGFRAKLGHVLEGKLVAIFVIVCTLIFVICTIIETLAEYTDILEESDGEKWVHSVSIAILFIFLLEQLLLILAFGKAFFTNMWYVTDFVVVCVSFVCEIVLADVAWLSLLMLVRLWKLGALIAQIWQGPEPVRAGQAGNAAQAPSQPFLPPTRQA